MKRIVTWAFILTALLEACHQRSETGQSVAVREPDEAGVRGEASPQIYVEAVMLLVPREDLRILPSRVAKLASRTDEAVVSAPHAWLESGRPEEFATPADSDGAAAFAWHFDADVLHDGTVRLGVGVVRQEPDEELATTLVLDSGQTAILPTLLSAPAGKVLVLVLQPEIIQSDQDLERILDETTPPTLAPRDHHARAVRTLTTPPEHAVRDTTVSGPQMPSLELPLKHV